MANVRRPAGDGPEREKPRTASGAAERPRAVVIGGSTGIGLACADRLALGGRRVTVSYHRRRPSCSVHAALPMDLTDSTSVDRFTEAVLADPSPIDVVVCSAGVLEDRSLVRLDRGGFERSFGANALGGMRAIDSLVPRLVDHANAAVCVVGSAVASLGNPSQSAYVAAKGSWVGFLRSLARDWGAAGVTANLIEPGLIDTEMVRGLPSRWWEDSLASIPMGRPGEAEEVAAVVEFLAGPAGRSVSGQVFRVDGGLLAKAAP